MQNDDKHSHFIMATTIPSNDLPVLSEYFKQYLTFYMKLIVESFVFLLDGLKNLQSSSFPDLTKRTASKNGLVSFMDVGMNTQSKTSRLPVASRYI